MTFALGCPSRKGLLLLSAQVRAQRAVLVQKRPEHSGHFLSACALQNKRRNRFFGFVLSWGLEGRCVP